MYGCYACPHCGRAQVLRSATRGLERLLKPFTRYRPYRCRACAWRGWCQVEGSARLRAAGLPAWLRRRSNA